MKKYRMTVLVDFEVDDKDELLASRKRSLDVAIRQGVALAPWVRRVELFPPIVYPAAAAEEKP